LYVPWCKKALYKYSSFPFPFPSHGGIYIPCNTCSQNNANANPNPNSNSRQMRQLYAASILSALSCFRGTDQVTENLQICRLVDMLTCRLASSQTGQLRRLVKLQSGQLTDATANSWMAASIFTYFEDN